MLKFRKQHKDAVIQIANYKGPITKDNISDPHVQRALAKHPKLWAEGNALEQADESVVDGPQLTADEAAGTEVKGEAQPESNKGATKAKK